MKKILAMLLALSLVLALAACGGKDPCESCVDENKDGVCDVCGEKVETPDPDPDLDPDPDNKTDYEKFMAAEIGDTVTVEAYVQDTQSWWDNKITIYAQSEHGGYLFYETVCSAEDAAKLVPGAKIKVTGPKAEYAGELEISGGTFEFIEAEPYIAEPLDVTAKIGTDELINYMNRKVLIKGAEVVAYDESGAAIEHRYGEPGDDIYFKVKVGDTVVNMCVEKYLTDNGTPVYEAVEALKVGDIINIECFLYWYNGANPHVTLVASESYYNFINAEIGDEITVEAYVQGSQSWWDNKITIYAEDRTGGYLFYETVCSADDAAKLVPGTKIKVTGAKAEYAGELEISGGTLEIIEGADTYVAAPIDVTGAVGTDYLADFMNRKAVIKGEVIAYDENGAAIEHRYGEPGDDIYYKIKVGDTVVNMCVEKYLTDDGTPTYEAVEALAVGDVVEIECFLYWYNGANPHTISVTVVTPDAE